MVAGQPEDISQVLANFTAIANVLNGQLDNSNLVANAGIVPSKLAGFPNDPTLFLRGDGGWVAPPTGGGGSGGTGLPADTVVPASTRIIANKLLSSDGQAAWQVMGDGAMRFGPGGSLVWDVNIYRESAGSLATDNSFTAYDGVWGARVPALKTQPAIGVWVKGENFDTWEVTAAGVMQWGPGGSVAPDSQLLRRNVGVIATPTSFMADQGGWFATLGQPATAVALGIYAVAGGKDTFDIWGNGRLNWGDGSTAQPGDTNLYRSAAGVLKTDGAFDGDFLQYYGDWSAGNYQDGDIAVYNGVAYLCVRPTTQQPSAWPTGGTVGGGTYGTALPASPIDGQIATLVDSITNPTYQWTFRYNAGSSSAYKWEFIGGTFASSEVDAASTTNVGTSWVVPSAGAASITVPRSGDYEVSFGGFLQFTTNASNGTIGLTIAIAGSVVATDAVTFALNNILGSASVSRQRRKTGLTAGNTISLQFQVNPNGGPVNTLSNQWLKVIPVRVS